MTEKKAKKTIKVRDLESSKDTRGGSRRHRSLLNQKEEPRHAPGGGSGIHKLQ